MTAVVDHKSTAGSPDSASRWLAHADRLLGWLSELPVALLVAAEVVILFTGIVARYVGRTGVDPVPLAGDVGNRCRLPPWRAYADDRFRQLGIATRAGVP